MKRTRRLRLCACSGNCTPHCLGSLLIPHAAPIPDIDIFMFIPDMFMPVMFMPAMFILTDGAVELIRRLTVFILFIRKKKTI